MIFERLFESMIRQELGDDARIDIHRLKMDAFERLAAKYGVERYDGSIVRVYDEPHQQEMWKSADIKYKGVKFTLYSENVPNLRYSDEAAKEHCKKTREARIAQAKRELEYLPKVNCETEGRMI